MNNLTGLEDDNREILSNKEVPALFEFLGAVSHRLQHKDVFYHFQFFSAQYKVGNNYVITNLKLKKVSFHVPSFDIHASCEDKGIKHLD